MQNSKIEWTHHTANPWIGCTKVATGCDNCYAEAFAKSKFKNTWGNSNSRKQTKNFLKNLNLWQRKAAAQGVNQRVFVGSMCDIFEKPMPVRNHLENEMPYYTDTIRDEFFNCIDLWPNLLFLLLTKRPSNINKYTPKKWKADPPENVMFGASVSNQYDAKTVFWHLSKVRGKRFVSIEPMTGSVDLFTRLKDKPHGDYFMRHTDWVIVGGESGHNRRPFHTDWARILRDQCAQVRKPFFFKQWDKIKEIPDDLKVRQFPLYHTSKLLV